MQVCHGEAGPPRRLRPGDGAADHSPTVAFGGGAPHRAPTALGVVTGGEAYPFDMGGSLRPGRRDGAWEVAGEVPIAPLLPRLDFTAGKPDRGRRLRFESLAVGPEGFGLVTAATSGI